MMLILRLLSVSEAHLNSLERLLGLSTDHTESSDGQHGSIKRD